MDDIWDGYTQGELDELDAEWDEFDEYLETHNYEYETGWE